MLWLRSMPSTREQERKEQLKACCCCKMDKATAVDDSERMSKILQEDEKKNGVSGRGFEDSQSKG